MSLVLIDTSAWLFNFPPRVVKPIRERITELVETDRAVVSSPVSFELLSGIRSKEEFDRFHRFLTSLHLLPFPQGEWTNAAKWARELRARGVQAKTVDLLIAYQAVTNGLTLLHADRDFDRIAKAGAFKVESYVSVVQTV